MKALNNVISASEFKKHCLHIIQEVKATGIPIVVTRRSTPIAQVMPINAEHNKSDETYFGFLKNTVTINADIINFSTQEEWEINNDE